MNQPTGQNDSFLATTPNPYEQLFGDIRAAGDVAMAGRAEASAADQAKNEAFLKEQAAARLKYIDNLDTRKTSVSEFMANSGMDSHEAMTTYLNRMDQIKAADDASFAKQENLDTDIGYFTGAKDLAVGVAGKALAMVPEFLGHAPAMMKAGQDIKQKLGSSLVEKGAEALGMGDELAEFKENMAPEIGSAMARATAKVESFLNYGTTKAAELGQAVAKPIKQVAEDLKSDAYKAQVEDAGAQVGEAAKMAENGDFSGALKHIGSTLASPGGAAMLAEGVLPSVLTGMAGTRMGVSALFNMAMSEGGSAASQAYDEVMKTPVDKLRESPEGKRLLEAEPEMSGEDLRKAIATKQSGEVGLLVSTVAPLLGKALNSAGIEEGAFLSQLRKRVTKEGAAEVVEEVAKKGVVKPAAVAAWNLTKKGVGEGVEEAGIGATESLASNVATKKNIDEKQSITEGIVGDTFTAGVLGAAGGHAMHSVGTVKPTAALVKAGIDKGTELVGDTKLGQKVKAQVAETKAKMAESRAKAGLPPKEEGVSPVTTERAKTVNQKFTEVEENLALIEANEGGKLSTENRRQLIMGIGRGLEDSYAKSDLSQADLIKAVGAIKRIQSHIDAETTQSTAAAVEKAKTNPSELTEEEGIQALSGAMTETGIGDSEIVSNLAGSRQLPPALQSFAKVLTNAASPVTRMLKSSTQVASEIIEGGEGFKGIRQHMQIALDAVAKGDEATAALVVKEITGWATTQAAKATSGRMANGNAIKKELMPQVKSESKAIDLIRDHITAIVSEKFPELGEIVTANAEDTAKLMINPAEGKKAKAIPTATAAPAKAGVVKQAMNLLFNPESKGVAGTEQQVLADRLKLSTEFGLNASKLKQVQAAMATMDDKSAAPKARAEAGKLVSDTHAQLVKSFGSSEALYDALAKQTDDTTELDAVFKPAAEPEFKYEPKETKLGHDPVPVVKGKVSVATLTQHSERVVALKEYSKTAPEAFTPEQLAKIEAFTDADPMADNLMDQLNDVISTVNEVQMPNAQIPNTVGSQNLGTTPDNKVFTNFVESLELGSKARDNVISIMGKVHGLLQSEENLLLKLRDKSSDYYKALTENLSSISKRNLDDMTSFMNSIHSGLDYTVVDMNKLSAADKAKLADWETTNYVLQEFIGEDGKLPESMKSAMALAAAEWVAANGYKSLNNNDEQIAKMMGESESYTPSVADRIAFGKGRLVTLLQESLGKAALQHMGIKGTPTGDKNYIPQLQANIGLAILNAMEHTARSGPMLEKRMAVRFENKTIGYGKIVNGKLEYFTTFGKPLTVPEGAARIPILVPVTKDEKSPEGYTQLSNKLERAINGIYDDAVSVNMFGSNTVSAVVFLDGQAIPERTEAQAANMPATVLDAERAQSETPYEADDTYINLVNSLDADYQERLLAHIPEVGDEHVNNVESNAARRQAVKASIDLMRDIKARMVAGDSATVRFLVRANKSNHRFQQANGPQGDKLVRSAFKPVDYKVMIDMSNPVHKLAYQMGVLEALDLDTAVGKGVDKSPDSAMDEAFNDLLQNKVLMDAAATIRSGENNKDLIQAALGTGGETSLKLDGLIALSAYNPDAPFETRLGKQNDGITNGVAIALLQFANATTFAEYATRLARCGIFVGDRSKQYTGFGEYMVATGEKDTYVTFADSIRKFLNDLVDHPYSDDSVTPTVKLKGADFTVNGMIAAAMKMRGTMVTKPNGSVVEEAMNGQNGIVASVEDYNKMTSAVDYFLGKQVVDADGNLVTLKSQVEKISRNFAKDPLMIFNYGAGIKGLRAAIASQVMSGITAAIEETNRIQDPQKRLDGFATIEQAVNQLSHIPKLELNEADAKARKARMAAERDAGKKYANQLTPAENAKLVPTKPFSIDAANPLNTPVDDVVFNDALTAVRFTYGASLERSFDEQYGESTKVAGKIIQMNRLSVLVYKHVLEGKLQKLMEANKGVVTNEQYADLQESMKQYAPRMRAPMSDDRAENGLLLAGLESTKDANELGKALSPANEIKIPRYHPETGKLTTSSGLTYSKKTKDPGVGTLAKSVQAIDAAAIGYTALNQSNAFVGVHDAVIMSLLDAAQGTKDGVNAGLNDSTIQYSMFTESLNTLKAVLANPDLDTAVMNAALESEAKTFDKVFGADTIESIVGLMGAEADRINAKRGIAAKVGSLSVQYNGGQASGVAVDAQVEATDAETGELWAQAMKGVLPEATETVPVASETTRIDEITRDKGSDLASALQAGNTADVIASLRESNDRSELDKMLASVPSDLVIEVLTTPEEVEAAGYTTHAAKANAAFLLKANKIVLFADQINDLAELRNTLMHELDHSASAAAIFAAGVGSKAAQIAKKFALQLSTADDLDRLPVGFVTELTAFLQGDKSDRSLLKFTAELSAWSKTDIDVREYMESIKLHEGKPLSQQIWRSIASMFGLTKRETDLYVLFSAATAKFYSATGASGEIMRTPEHQAVMAYEPKTAINKAIKHELLLAMARGTQFKDLRSAKSSARTAMVTKIQGKAQFKEMSEADIKEAIATVVSTRVTAASKLTTLSQDEVFYQRNRSTASGSNMLSLFEQLGETNSAVKPSTKHAAQLRNVLNMIAPTVTNIGVKFSEVEGETFGQANNGQIEVNINLGTKVNQLEMSPQEVFVHELLHPFLWRVRHTGAKFYSEVERDYAYALKHLTPADFLTGITNPTEADRQEAQKRYTHTVHNRIDGSHSYTTFLNETKKRVNSNPVDEYYVMSLTNEPLIKALASMQARNKVTTANNTFAEKGLNILNKIMTFLGEDLTKVRGLTRDKRSVQLLSLIAGTLDVKHNLLTKSYDLTVGQVDKMNTVAQSLFAKTSLGKKVPAYKAIAQTYGKDALAELRKKVTDTAAGKSEFLANLGSELTLGRYGLREVVELLTKSSKFIEQASQEVKEYVANAIKTNLPNMTKEDSTALYYLVGKADMSALAKQFSVGQIVDMLTDRQVLDHAIYTLQKAMMVTAGKDYNWVRTNAEDLGYHMVTGNRMFAAGGTKNALQIVRKYGLDNAAPVQNADEVMAQVDMLASLYALKYSPQSLPKRFMDAKGTSELSAAIALQQQVKELSQEQGFTTDPENYRKGYMADQYDNPVKVVMAPASQRERLEKEGYTMQGAAQVDPTIGNQIPLFYFVSTASSPERYLTGVMSTQSVGKKGHELFATVGVSAKEALKNSLDEKRMFAARQAQLKAMAINGGVRLGLKEREGMAESNFDSNGRLVGFSRVAGDAVKDRLLGRTTDLGDSLGTTLASVNRRNQTLVINTQAAEKIHDIFKKEYKQFPNEFIELSRNDERYKLLPEATRAKFRQLFGAGKPIMIRREQANIWLGYRKMGISQLTKMDTTNLILWDKAKADLNNMLYAALHREGVIKAEQFWMDMVSMAKDAIVIKSGAVTMANIMSNVALLYMSGVPIPTAIKGTVQAYRDTYQYRTDRAELDKKQGELYKPNLTTSEQNTLKTEIIVLQNKLYNNPVRQLMEAGMYQAIVDDVDVGEGKKALHRAAEDKLAPIISKLPVPVRSFYKHATLQHDTKWYQVMRDFAQISDFAGRQVLHTHNVKVKGMKPSDSIHDVSMTFINYDIPQSRGLQYANDIGLAGFTKYLFRIQNVLTKRFGENPARFITTALVGDFLNMPVPMDAAMTGPDVIMSRFFKSPLEWLAMNGEVITLQAFDYAGDMVTSD